MMEARTARREDTWANAVCERLNASLEAATKRRPSYQVLSKQELPYRNEVFGYRSGGVPNSGLSPSKASAFVSYQTDLLVVENQSAKTWIPRVVIECKLSRINTHDAIIYSAKAATHKQVHPYLRYGILLGAHEAKNFPGRVFRHGAYFDFMVTWRSEKATADEWRKMVKLIKAEIRASRQTEQFIRESSKKSYRIIHRPLVFLR